MKYQTATSLYYSLPYIIIGCSQNILEIIYQTQFEGEIMTTERSRFRILNKFSKSSLDMRANQYKI